MNIYQLFHAVFPFKNLMNRQIQEIQAQNKNFFFTFCGVYELQLIRYLSNILQKLEVKKGKVYDDFPNFSERGDVAITREIVPVFRL